MRLTVKLAIAVSFAIPLSGFAQGQSHLSCVKDVSYSKEFLSKFPDAPAACNEVREQNGKKWVRFNAEVKKVEGNHMTMTFMDKEEHPISTLVFSFDPQATVTTEDDEVKSASKVEEGDKLKVWMPEDRFGVNAKPGASESQHFALVGTGSHEE